MERTNLLSTIRSEVTGGDEKSVLMQMSNEFKKESRKAREELLREIGFHTGEISAGQGLAMKAELALPWHKLRHLRR